MAESGEPVRWSMKVKPSSSGATCIDLVRVSHAGATLDVPPVSSTLLAYILIYFSSSQGASATANAAIQQLETSAYAQTVTAECLSLDFRSTLFDATLDYSVSDDEDILKTMYGTPLIVCGLSADYMPQNCWPGACHT